MCLPEGKHTTEAQHERKNGTADASAQGRNGTELNVHFHLFSPLYLCSIYL